MKSKANSNLFTGFFKETLIVQIALATVLAISLWFFDYSLNLINGDDSQYASLLINYDGGKRMFEGEVIEGMTVLDALNASTLAGDIELDFSYSSDGKTSVNQIDGYSNGGRRPYFYLNDVEIKMEEIGNILIRAGDRVEIIFK